MKESEGHQANRMTMDCNINEINEHDHTTEASLMKGKNKCEHTEDGKGTEAHTTAKGQWNENPSF